MFKLPKLSKTERAWVLYDVANSAFILTVITIFFPILYKMIFMDSEGIGLIPDTQAYDDVWTTGSVIFKYLTSAIALTIAILSPIMGAWSNYAGNKKKFFKIFLFMGILGGIGLTIPGLGWVTLLVLFTISSMGYNFTNVLYDAFLVDVTDEENYDEISATGYAWGYIGSLIPFFIGIIPFGLVALEKIPESYSQISITFAFIVSLVWWFYYSLPLIRDVEQKYSIEQSENSLRESFQRLRKTFKDIRSYKMIFLFLIAYLLFIDVVNTVIRLATNIGGDLGVSDITMLAVIVMVQVIAFPSAILYAKMVKKIGGKPMLFYGIFIYAIAVYVVFMITEDTTYLMWVVGAIVGTAQGGIQSLARSFFAKMVPAEKANDFFGFYSVFGRFGGILSPFLIASFQVSLGINKAVLLLLIPLAVASVVLAFVKEGKVDLVE
ncbi:MAG: Vacuole effluxer Atg22 like protein [Candidatus Izimaplasma bacterium HR2]|nr:MAG: Vacuole effluxer Atg22 like protein [Candidatus Izimaplasma bacterium HR2]